ncbi:helix-turn-helix domain-containing protein [Actinospica durhamensis]|uniref:Helix-turn-helix domain-containing protein n=1 Tax=Actinospica durhamensis TaxID=1508375 RepID=A0A941EJJ9_9ACTN|nr:helix-turn-helix domain-containing protein [Actinospica durhamensis]MBR7832561.1 helix-turn-helix domain-containing protein [Actinospica durhamensis]
MPPLRTDDQTPRQPHPYAGTDTAAFEDLLTWAETRLGTPLSVDDLAAQLGVSPRTLSRRFTERLGIGPGAWLLSRRVTAARALLEDTDLPVEAIAARVGLASPVNLRRRFRDQVGTTPGAYRRASRSP